MQTNRTRIYCGAARVAGLAVGSGPVEGACKHLVQARFKRAGMRWNRAGFLDILEILLARLNGTLDRFCRDRQRVRSAA